MKGAIIYKGKYGATQQYANWLADEAFLDVFSSSAIKGGKLDKYDFLVIGSSVYIGKLDKKMAKKKSSLFTGEKNILLPSSGNSP